MNQNNRIPTKQFRFDSAGNTPIEVEEFFAARGGTPEAWPEWVKEYFRNWSGFPECYNCHKEYEPLTGDGDGLCFACYNIPMIKQHIAAYGDEHNENCPLCGVKAMDDFIPSTVLEEGYTLERAKSSVGEGWHPLLEKVFEIKEQNSFRTPNNEPFKIVQVKEKFGILRIYHNWYDEWSFMTLAINHAEFLSQRTCEICGKSATTKPSARGWIKTLCKAHHKERNFPG